MQSPDQDSITGEVDENGIDIFTRAMTQASVALFVRDFDRPFREFLRVVRDHSDEESPETIEHARTAELLIKSVQKMANGLLTISDRNPELVKLQALAMANAALAVGHAVARANYATGAMAIGELLPQVEKMTAAQVKGGEATAKLTSEEWQLVIKVRDQLYKSGLSAKAASVRIAAELYHGRFDGIERTVMISSETIRKKKGGNRSAPT